jgi:hypothetical protein
MRKRKITLTKLKIKKKCKRLKHLFKESKLAEFHDLVIMHRTLNSVLIIICL